MAGSAFQQDMRFPLNWRELNAPDVVVAVHALHAPFGHLGLGNHGGSHHAEIRFLNVSQVDNADGVGGEYLVLQGDQAARGTDHNRVRIFEEATSRLVKAEDPDGKAHPDAFAVL